MYRSLGNVLRSPNVGLLFIRFGGTSDRLRVNGLAEIDFKHPRLAEYPGAKMMVRLAAREIFPNCPRYVPDLAGGRASEYLPGAEGPGTRPAWKDRDYIRPILPGADPHRRREES